MWIVTLLRVGLPQGSWRTSCPHTPNGSSGPSPVPRGHSHRSPESAVHRLDRSAPPSGTWTEEGWAGRQWELPQGCGEDRPSQATGRCPEPLSHVHTHHAQRWAESGQSKEQADGDKQGPQRRDFLQPFWFTIFLNKKCDKHPPTYTHLLFINYLRIPLHEYASGCQV